MIVLEMVVGVTLGITEDVLVEATFSEEKMVSLPLESFNKIASFPFILITVAVDPLGPC